MNKFNAFEQQVDFSFFKTLIEKNNPKLVPFKKGEYFACEGEVMESVGWIVSGGFKHCLTTGKGEIRTVGFVFEESPIANYLSICFQSPLTTDIIAIEDSMVLTIDSKVIFSYLMDHPELNLKLSQSLFAQAYLHSLNNYRYSPKERFHHLINKFPQLINLVPIGEIASFLNISRGHLHRIISGCNKCDS